MGKNVGGLDRILRIILGLGLIAYAIPLGFPHTGWNAVGWIGVVPLLTAMAGSCPLYSIAGIFDLPAKLRPRAPWRRTKARLSRVKR
ncbi:MAG: DUF2892 domain-containing protein [Roseiarcus sp.]|uniref:YgaP family membrane protein n=1 Tax=Roseiarcus sp. TaxID=1969460 RepID=UPI003BAE243A